MKKLFLAIVMLACISAKAQESFTFSTDSMQYGMRIEYNISTPLTAVVIKGESSIVLYTFHFSCGKRYSYVDQEIYLIKKEVKDKKLGLYAKMYETTIGGESAIVILDDFSKMAVFYAHGDRKDMLVFKGQ